MNARTLSDLLPEFLEHRHALGNSPGTRKTLFYGIRRFLAWLERRCGVSTPERLRREQLHDYQRHLHLFRTKRGVPLNPRTVNCRVEAVHGFLAWLAERGLVPPGLHRSLACVKEPELLPTSVLTHAQVRRELARISTRTPAGYRDRTIMELLYSTAIRASELLGIRIGDIDLDNACIKVMGKGSKERMVPVGKTARRFLETYLKAVRPCWPQPPDCTVLFLNVRGRPMSQKNLNDMILARSRTSGLPVHYTPHTFRRSCATELIRGNANVYHVKDLLGHASLGPTPPYIRLVINDLRKTHAKCHPREKDRG